MLQQTRVEAVKPYFDRFMEALPTVYDLAKVDDDRLMKLWEGTWLLQSGKRDLKAAAQTIVEEYGGQLPADYDKLLSLKGIGMYTAGQSDRSHLNYRFCGRCKCSSCDC